MSTVALKNDAHDHKGRFAPKGQGVSFDHLPDGWHVTGTDGTPTLERPTPDGFIEKSMTDARGVWKDLPPKAQETVRRWTTLDNKVMRQDVANGRGADIEADLAQLPEVDGVFYRGVKYGGGFSDRPSTPEGWRKAIGSTMTMRAPGSASLDPSKAAGFTEQTAYGNVSPVVLEIRGKGRSLVGLGRAPHELEVVVPTGGYKVADVYEARVPRSRATYTVVRLEQQ